LFIAIAQFYEHFFSFSFCWLFGGQGFLCCPDAFAVTAGTDRTIRYFDLREGAYGRSYRVSAPDVYPNTSAQHHVLYVNNQLFCISDFVVVVVKSILYSLCPYFTFRFYFVWHFFQKKGSRGATKGTP
jgi:hypothetical protein